MTTKLLLHGVPETAAIWTDLIGELSVDGDVRTLSLPGFGTARPDGFDCSMQAYAAWLTAEVDAAAEVDARDDIHAVILFGGHEIFCAGDDMPELLTLDGPGAAIAAQAGAVMPAKVSK